MQRATPYLNFRGEAEAAFEHYRRVFGGDYTGLMRFRDMGTPPDDPDADLVAHVSLPIARETVLMGSDVPSVGVEHFSVGNNVLIHLAADDADEARRVFAALSDGGSVTMPLERTAWAELFGSCTDRFGIGWMVDFTGEVVYAAP